MGCSISKELESPSRNQKESWGAVLPKGLAVQVDRSLKTTDAGYIAAIFSSNYGSLRKPGPVKALERNVPVRASERNDLLLSQMPPVTGNYSQNKLSKAVRANPQVLRKTLSETTLGLPKFSLENVEETVAGQKSTEGTKANLETINTWELMQGQKSMEGTKANLETINTWELMQGLDEEEDSANREPSFAPLLSLPALDGEVSPAVFPNKPTDDTPTFKASSGKKVAARRPRPKSFTSIKSIEDVDAVIAARKSNTPPPVWDRSSGKACQNDEEARELSLASLLSAHKVLNKPTSRPTCETSSNAEATPISTSNERSAQNPDNLQRALSLKYIFSDSTDEKQGSPNPAESSSASQLSEANARDSNSDSLVFATARLLSEGEGNSAPSSPDFSAAASLKDWLPSDNHPLKHTDDFKGGFEPSFLEAFQTTQLHSVQQTTPHLLPPSKKVRSKYVGGGSDQFLKSALKKALQCQEEADQLSIKVENYEASIFDPELLDSFEKATKELSKEEWNALRSMEDSPQNLNAFRSMEDSPRNFLRLVNSFQRSSSNSVHNLKTTAKTSADLVAIARNEDGNRMNGSTVANANKIVVTGQQGGPTLYPKPDDSKPKKFLQEKKLPFSRQNSWELKKGTTKAGRDDEDRVNVVFYCTTSQTDIKLYENCNQVRGILKSLVGVPYDERSISENPEYEQELKHALDMPAAIVPTVYLKGKYVVGVDSILQLYKKGMLGSMLREALSVGSKTKVSCICRGGNFLICPLCKGRRKLNRLGEGASSCRHCSGTGLIRCPNCSST